MKFDIQLNKCWTMKLKKQMFKRRKRKTSKPGEPHEPELISQTCNLLSPTLELDQEAQYPTNLILKKKTKEKKSI